MIIKKALVINLRTEILNFIKKNDCVKIFDFRLLK